MLQQAVLLVYAVLQCVRAAMVVTIDWVVDAMGKDVVLGVQ
jgi:hypothetical protein